MYETVLGATPGHLSMVANNIRRVLKEGASVRFRYGLRQVDGKVVEAIVPLRTDQPVIYRVVFSLPDEDHLEVVLREGDVTPLDHRPSHRRRAHA
jgi:hypothetical protein